MEEDHFVGVVKVRLMPTVYATLEHPAGLPTEGVVAFAVDYARRTVLPLKSYEV
ncbi:MAG: hypothetical protein ACNA8W_06350 [Bradymonadaceae bacterium]